MILTHIRLLFFIFLLFGCHTNNNNENKVELLASKNMLNYSYSHEYKNYNPLISVTTPPPRTQEAFLKIKLNSDNGDANSSLLLFNLFERDSNCMYLGLNKKAKPNRNCLSAVEYLKRALIQEPNNSLALYEYAILHYRGITFPQSRDKAVEYMDKIIHKDERDAALVCEYLVYIYTSNEDGKGVNYDRAKQYAKMGAKAGNKLCERFLIKNKSKNVNSKVARTLKFYDSSLIDNMRSII